MTLLRNILFEPLFYVGSIILCLGVAILALVSEPAARWGASVWSNYVRLIVRWVLGIRIVKGGMLPDGPVIVALKHESFLEALLLPGLFPNGAVVMKQELRRIPVWGWLVTRQGSIFVDRQAKASALRDMMRRAARANEAGRPIVIFPEGSRAQPGEEPPLQPGIAGLYKLLRLPVVPVSLRTAHLWPRKGLKKRGEVILTVMPEIPPGLPREQFERTLHAAINGHWRI